MDGQSQRVSDMIPRGSNLALVIRQIRLHDARQNFHQYWKADDFRTYEVCADEGWLRSWKTMK